MSQIYNSATSDVPPKTIKIGVGGNNYEDVYKGCVHKLPLNKARV